jgi:hypothetical protein
MKHHDASLTGCQIDDPEGSDASLSLGNPSDTKSVGGGGVEM